MKVLLIEDDEQDSIFVRNLLSAIRTPRHQLEWQRTFRDGLAAIERRDHDVCLMDFDLGDANGLDLLRALEADPTMPVIMLTRTEDYERDVAAAQAGASDYLVKSHINVPLLERSIRYAIERHQNEKEINRLNRLFFALSSINQAIVRLTSITDLFDRVCEVLVEQGGFRMAWIGWHDPETHVLEPVAVWGDDSGYLKNIQIYADDRPGGRGPTGRAYRGGQPYICNDTLNDPVMLLWRNDMDRPEFRSAAAFPIRAHGEISGVLNVYADESGFFKDKEAALLLQAASDISFGLDNIDREDERLLTERTMRESEARFRTLFEYAPDGIVISDPKGFYLDGNESMCRIMGLTRDELIGMHISDIVVPAENPIVTGRHGELNEELNYEREWHFRRDDGSIFVGEVIATKMPDGNLLAMIRDVTRRKQWEEELRGSESRLREVMRRTRCILWSGEVQGLPGWENDDRTPASFAWTLSIHAEEAAQQVLALDVQPGEGYDRAFYVSRLDEDKIRSDIKGMEACVSGVPNYTQEFRCRDRYGEIRFLHEDVTVDTVGHGRWKIFGVVTDISDRKMAEAALEQALDKLETRVSERTQELAQTNSALAAEIVERQIAETEFQRGRTELQSFIDAMSTLATKVTLDGTFLIVNKIAMDSSGLSYEEHMATNFLDGPWWTFDPEVHHRVREKFAEACKGTAINYDEYVCAFGEIRSINFSLIPVRDAAGNIDHIVAEGRDITKLKETESELQLAKQEADRANAAKSEFLSRMSHELRTPLNAILGFGQILERQDLGAKNQASLSHILGGGRHLLNLINEVLDISRVEAGQLEMSLQSVDLVAAISEACAMVLPLASERNIHLAAGASNLSQARVLADPQRLKQVLLNLLANAIKFNWEGGWVEVNWLARPEGRIAIAVRDGGPGISAPDLLKLFTPFERLAASKSQIEGTGLGLVLSRRLVSAMGGTLTVDSTVGHGATFTVELAQPEVVRDQTMVETENPETSPEEKPADDNYSVLCVEDNLSNLRLIQLVLHDRQDIKLLTAMKGQTGLELAAQHRPDVVLLDLNLPDISGEVVLKSLRQADATSHIPVIIVSADATPGQVERLLAAGASAYLTKPLDVEKFLLTLDQFLPLKTANA